MRTFILGLSIGGGCIAHCGSVLLPLLLCETRRRLLLAGIFLISRLAGYLIFAILTFFAGSVIGEFLNPHGFLEGMIYLLLAFLLVRYSWNLRDTLACAQGCGSGKADFPAFRKNSMSYAVQAGLLTGLSLCTPFMAVVTEGLRAQSLVGIMSQFGWFYLGTTVVLIPVLVGGVISRGRSVRQIGFLCGLFAAFLYSVQGIIIIAGELYHGIH